MKLNHYCAVAINGGADSSIFVLLYIKKNTFVAKCELAFIFITIFTRIGEKYCIF